MPIMATGPHVPPYQVQTLLGDVYGQTGARITCAQALGNEIYVGTSNGELFQFMQVDGGQYIIVARQTLPGEKPIDDIVLIPSILKALVRSDRQIHFYTLPHLELEPIKPIRNVMTFAVDAHHLRRPAPKSIPNLGYVPVAEPVDFSVVKRAAIAMFTLKDKLFYSREIPLPQNQGVGCTLARRAGKYICFADKENYNLVDLEGAQLFPILPIAQAPAQAGAVIRPLINVISDNEFLILSWTGTNTLGLFITGDGDPVRGTLEWPAYPLGICFDQPNVTTLLPDGTIEIHSVESQEPLQVIAPPKPVSPSTSPATSPRQQETPVSEPMRIAMAASVGGYQVPSVHRAERMQKVPFKLVR